MTVDTHTSPELDLIGNMKDKVIECKNGPKIVIEREISNKKFRLFIGDIDDLMNIECMSVFNVVLTAGKNDYLDGLLKIFNQKAIKEDGGKEKNPIVKLKNPFNNYQVRDAKVVKNGSEESVFKFKYTDAKGVENEKRLIFVHFSEADVADKDKKRVKAILSKISAAEGDRNYLAIVDHLQPDSLKLLKEVMEKNTENLTYKGRKVFG